MKKLFVFDLDDTLIDNVHDYSESILQMCRIIINELKSTAPHVYAIIALEEELDLQRKSQINPKTGKSYGYSMERFPGTLRETYRTICERAGIDTNKHVETSLYYTGMGAFDPNRYSKNIKPDAKEVVDFLRSQGDAVVLCTAGDPVVQNRKIAAMEYSGITFEKQEIVDRKRTDVFTKLSADLAGHDLYSVGNNYKSDIVPAMEAGFRGIYIPVETWETIGKMESIFAEVDQERCLVLHSLSDIKEKYSELK